MKIKMFIPIALVLCLAFSLCACGTTANTNETTTAPATTVATEATTAADTEATTTAPAETEADAEATFTEEDALALVQNSYDFSDDYYFLSKGLMDVDGTNYYAVDLRKYNDTNSTYISTYFVETDGSEIHTGYIAGGVPVISDGAESTVEITEDNAVKAVEAAYDFEDGCFLNLRGTEEINGTTYFAVDLMKSLESNTTYLSTYFVTENGEIVTGYYEGGVAYLAE